MTFAFVFTFIRICLSFLLQENLCIANYGGNVESHEATWKKAYSSDSKSDSLDHSLTSTLSQQGEYCIKKIVLADRSVLVKCTSTQIAVCKCVQLKKRIKVLTKTTIGYLLHKPRPWLLSCCRDGSYLCCSQFLRELLDLLLLLNEELLNRGQSLLQLAHCGGEEQEGRHQLNSEESKPRR